MLYAVRVMQKKAFSLESIFLEDVPLFRGRPLRFRLGDVLFSPRHLKYTLLEINVYFSQLMTIIYLLFL